MDEAVLSDLKHLLVEAKQRVPPFLAAIQTEADQLNEDMGKSNARSETEDPSDGYKPVLWMVVTSVLTPTDEIVKAKLYPTDDLLAPPLFGNCLVLAYHFPLPVGSYLVLSAYFCA